MAYKTFANGFPLPASDLNNYLMNQSVIVFADAAERTSVLAAPTEGMITYLEDANNYQYWDGAAWTDLVESPDLSTLIPKSTVTTAGDLIVADGASSVTRLGAGSDGSLLTVDSGSPAYLAPGTDDQVLTLVSGSPQWSTQSAPVATTDWTLLATATLPTGGSASTVTFTPGYDKYSIFLDQASTTAPSPSMIYMVLKDQSGGNIGYEIDNSTYVITGSSLKSTNRLNNSPFLWVSIMPGYQEFFGNLVLTGASQAGKMISDYRFGGIVESTQNRTFFGNAAYNIASGKQLGGITFETSAGVYNGGTIKIYGA